MSQNGSRSCVKTTALYLQVIDSSCLQAACVQWGRSTSERWSVAKRQLGRSPKIKLEMVRFSLAATYIYICMRLIVKLQASGVLCSNYNVACFDGSIMQLYLCIQESPHLPLDAGMGKQVEGVAAGGHCLVCFWWLLWVVSSTSQETHGGKTGRGCCCWWTLSCVFLMIVVGGLLYLSGDTEGKQVEGVAAGGHSLVCLWWLLWVVSSTSQETQRPTQDPVSTYH